MLFIPTVLPNTNMAAKKRMKMATNTGKTARAHTVKETQSLLSPAFNESKGKCYLNTESESDFALGQRITILKGYNHFSFQ